MAEQGEVPDEISQVTVNDGLKEGIVPQVEKLRLTQENIIDKLTPENILQKGKVILPDNVRSEINDLVMLTKVESGLTSVERVRASSQFSKVVREIAGAMYYSQSQFSEYKPVSLEESTDIVTHNSKVGNDLLSVFVDGIDDPDRGVAYYAVYDFERCSSEFLSLGSRFKLAPELAEKVSLKINQKAEQGVFDLKSDENRSPATVLAMVAPK